MFLLYNITSFSISNIG